MSDVFAGFTDEQIARAMIPKRSRRRVSLNTLAKAREPSPFSVHTRAGAFICKVTGKPAAIWIRVRTRRERFVAMFKIEQAEIAARLSTYALVHELRKRGLDSETLILGDALAERGLPEGDALQHFSGRLAAMRRGTSTPSTTSAGEPRSSARLDLTVEPGTREGGSVAQVANPGDEVTGASGDGG